MPISCGARLEDEADGLEDDDTGPAGAPLVLVAEPHLDSRDLIAEFLLWKGLRTRSVADGVIVSQLIKRHRPDVVLLNLRMPGVSGWEIVRRLKAEQATCHVPIILTSSDVLRHESARARLVRCHGFLSKPIDLGALWAAVRSALHHRSKKVAAGVHESAPGDWWL